MTQEPIPLPLLINAALSAGSTMSALAKQVGCSRMQLWRIQTGRSSENTRIARMVRANLERSETSTSFQELTLTLRRIAGEEPRRVRLLLQMLQTVIELAEPR